MSKKYNLAYRLLGEGFKKFTIKYEDGLDIDDFMKKMKNINPKVEFEEISKYSEDDIKDAVENWLAANSLNLTEEQKDQIENVRYGWTRGAKANPAGGPFLELLKTMTTSDVKDIASLNSFSGFTSFPTTPFWSALANLAVGGSGGTSTGAGEMALCLMVKNSVVGDDSGKGKQDQRIVSDVVIRGSGRRGGPKGENCNPKIGDSSRGSDNAEAFKGYYRLEMLKFRRSFKILKELFKTEAQQKGYPMEASKSKNFGKLGRNSLNETALKEYISFKLADLNCNFNDKDISDICDEIIALTVHCACLALTREFIEKGKKTQSYILVGADINNTDMIKVTRDHYSIPVIGWGPNGRTTMTHWGKAESNKMWKKLIDKTGVTPNGGDPGIKDSDFRALTYFSTQCFDNSLVQSDDTEIVTSETLFKKPLIETLGLK